jgi:hypothetical protein
VCWIGDGAGVGGVIVCVGQHSRAGHITGGPGVVLVVVSRIEAWAGDGVSGAGMLRATAAGAVTGYLQSAFGRGWGVWCG